MIKKMKLFSILMVLVLAMGMTVSCSKNSEESAGGDFSDAATAENPWQCGATDSDTVNAYIDGTTLWLSGAGQMADYETPEDRPWNKYAADIDQVFLDSELTTVGKNAFCGIGTNTDGADIFIGAPLTSIGDSAFEGMNFATYSMPTLPESLETIGKKAFADATFAEMFYDGKPKDISDDAFSGVNAVIHVRDDKGWTEADEKQFGGTLEYKLQYALAYEGVFSGGEMQSEEGVEYHDANEEFEFNPSLNAEGYTFDHYEVLSGNLKIKDPKNPVLTIKLTDNVKIKYYFNK